MDNPSEGSEPLMLHQEYSSSSLSDVALQVIQAAHYAIRKSLSTVFPVPVVEMVLPLQKPYTDPKTLEPIPQQTNRPRQCDAWKREKQYPVETVHTKRNAIAAQSED